MPTTTKPRDTFTGGYDYIIRVIDRGTDEQALRTRLWNHYDTPQSERGPFWQGAQVALVEAIHALEGAAA